MANSPYKRDPDRIEDEIDNTRSRIESRLDLLSAQFSPSNLIDRALNTGEATSNGDQFGLMMERARSNPLSAALIAAGLAGMMLQKPEPRPVETTDRHPIEPYSNDPAERIAHNLSTLETQADSLRDDVSSTAGSIADSVSSAAATVRSAAGDMVDRVTGSAERTSRDAEIAYVRTRYRTERKADEVRQTLRDAPVRAKAGAEYAADWVKENPLPSGLFALALGATVATIFAAGQSTEPRRRSRFTEDDMDREAAARATRVAAVATTRTRRENAAAAVAASEPAAGTAPKMAKPKAKSNKTAPLLKTAPDTGSKTISPRTKRSTAPKP